MKAINQTHRMTRLRTRKYLAAILMLCGLLNCLTGALLACNPDPPCDDGDDCTAGQECCAGTCITACDSSECEECNETSGYCEDGCGNCQTCVSEECEDVEVSSVTGPSGNNYVDDEESVSCITNYTLPETCTITWSGDATFSNISGTSATATLTSTGTGLEVSAKAESTVVDQSGDFAVGELLSFTTKGEPHWPKCENTVSISRDDFHITTDITSFASQVNVSPESTAAGTWDATATLFGGPSPGITSEYTIEPEGEYWSTVQDNPVSDTVTNGVFKEETYDNPINRGGYQYKMSGTFSGTVEADFGNRSG